MRAIVRPPGESYARALSGQEPRPVLDVVRARQQHAEYRAALRAAGVELMELPPDERYPDACFVQDTAVVYGGLAVLARLGAESRRGEEVGSGQILRATDSLRVSEIRAPATLEGGDVLVMRSRVWVGLSDRTNRAAFAQLRDLLELEGAVVQAVAVHEGLHLLSGCTYLGQGVLLAAGAWADLPAFAGLEVIRVSPQEAYAANSLGLGEFALVPAGFPHTAAQIRACGFQVLAVDLSEFAKADGGATCLSLLF